MLVDADLCGLLIGMTLATTPAEIYRALIEATAFGTRVIIDAFEASGVPVDAVVACGGLPRAKPAADADLRRRHRAPWRVAASAQTPALGSAMFAAVAAGPAAGGYATIVEAAERDGAPVERDVPADPGRRAIYELLYRQYVSLHDLFGRGGSDAMKALRRIREQALSRGLEPERTP